MLLSLLPGEPSACTSACSAWWRTILQLRGQAFDSCSHSQFGVPDGGFFRAYIALSAVES